MLFTPLVPRVQRNPGAADGCRAVSGRVQTVLTEHLMPIEIERRF